MPTYARATVNFAGSTVTCNPDPVPVSRASNNGVEWTANQTGYTFTGVSIDDNDAPWGDFGTPQITTNAAGQSVMSVSDSVADTGDYSYTLHYTDPTGNAGRFDPTIRNER